MPFLPVDLKTFNLRGPFGTASVGGRPSSSLAPREGVRGFCDPQPDYGVALVTERIEYRIGAGGMEAGRIGPLIGHRGVAAHAPENTLASLRKAAKMGIRWVEFDVRLSRDGHPVLFHDERLSRTTDGRGRVADHDLVELKRLDAGAGFDPAFRGERIPTLNEAIDVLQALGLGANVEIKPDGDRETETAQAVFRTLKGFWPGALPPPIVSSFSTLALAVSAAGAPEWEHALLVEAIPRDWRRRLEATGSTALHCNARRLDRERAAEVIAAAVPLRCYTVNSVRMARKLFAWGVSAVFTDAPDRLSAGLGTKPVARL
jgi:glycerophosphoryl diester phosphodiesterase